MARPSLIHFPLFQEKNGMLAVFESGKHVPFNIGRVFTVSANKNDVRGEHAHKNCSQILICLAGEIRVDCDDAFSVMKYTLNGLSVGLLLPPLTWSSQSYLINNSLLMVLCDQPYDEKDYIRDYDQFRKIILGAGLDKIT